MGTITTEREFAIGIPRDLSPVYSAIRSANYWLQRDPLLAHQLQVYAMYHDSLLDQAKDKFVIILGDKVLEDTFDTYADARLNAEERFPDRYGLIHHVRSQAIQVDRVYDQAFPYLDEFKLFTNHHLQHVNFPRNHSYRISEIEKDQKISFVLNEGSYF